MQNAECKVNSDTKKCEWREATAWHPPLGPFWSRVPELLCATRRFAKFGLVGFSGVLVDTGVFFLLADARTLEWDFSVSKVLAAEAAILNNFVWNEVWTFRDLAADRTSWRDRLSRLGKFNVICTAGIVLSVLLLNAQVRTLGMNIYAANLIAILVVSLWNFWMNLRFGWGQRVASSPRKQETARGPGHK